MLLVPERSGQVWLVLSDRSHYRSFSRLILSVVLSAIVWGGPSALAGSPEKHVRQEPGPAERLEAEQRLWDLGYWAGPIDGKFDANSRHALIAFQKVEGRKRTGILTRAELKALQSASRPSPREEEGYAHLEVDLTRQVLFLVDAVGAVTRILPVSTGNGESYIDHGEVHRATTPRGTFKVLRKINGWRKSSLGLLYYPNYIVDGVAIHGSPSVPAYPASHGCIRIPMFAAKELSQQAPVGTVVVLY